MTYAPWRLDVQLPPGYTLLTYGSLAGTNSEAKRLAAEGAAEGTLVVAREQTAGRGRGGRIWSSPPGNLYSSLILRPAADASTAAQLSFAAALAVSDAVAALAPGAAVTVKWPNDVLADGGKIAGILLESTTGRGGAVDWLVVGVGINVGHHPSDAQVAATSLQGLGASVSVADCLAAYVAAFARWYAAWRQDGFAALRQGWLARCAGLGRAVRVRLPQAEYEATFRDLDADGALVVELPNGERRRITAGEVFFARQAS